VKGFSSKAVHGATLKKDSQGALRFPVYDSVAFGADSARDLELAFAGKKAEHVYSRITNPTVEDFEQKVRLLSDAFGVIAVSSGMAAITETIMALAQIGSNIITSTFLFGNTVSLFEKTFKRWGLEVRHADMTDPSSLGPLIDDRTGLVFLEVITNPQLEVADVSKICAITADRRVPVVLDGTLTTPYLFRSRDAGVAVEIISSTKYMSGGATSVGGVIIDNGVFDWSKTPSLSADAVTMGPAVFLMRLRREIHRNTGSCMSPHNAWLQSLGLETLSLRIEKSCANALAVAQFLNTKQSTIPVCPVHRFMKLLCVNFPAGSADY
jgi:O-acetylhomoserine (thiol)-lyase